MFAAVGMCGEHACSDACISDDQSPGGAIWRRLPITIRPGRSVKDKKGRYGALTVIQVVFLSCRVMCRTALRFFNARRHTSAGISSGRDDVCVSVTRRYCIETATRIKLFSAYGHLSTYATLCFKKINISPNITALPSRTLSQILDFVF